jgi:hypothetical protein
MSKMSERMIRMTRFELQIAEAIKGSSDTDYINMIQKLKTQDGFIYTIVKCKYPKETMSEEQYFYLLYNCALTYMDTVRTSMLTEKIIWTIDEGRIIHADNIKEVWIEFNNSSEMSISLEENCNMIFQIPAQNPPMGKPIG